jgi:hypothetical protein
MIQARAMQLYDFTRNLKKLRFADAFSYLTVDPYSNFNRNEKYKRWQAGGNTRLAKDANILAPLSRETLIKQRSKEFAGARLEYSFGWRPLIQDIYNAARIIDRPIKAKIIRGRATGTLDGNLPASPGNVHYESKARVQIITDMVVSNPNVAMLNHLGVLNPFSIAWELLPWSFVADWFGNFGQWLGSLSDFIGLELTNTAVTKMHNSNGEWVVPPPWNLSYDISTFQIIRGGSLEPPKLIISPLPDFSPGRAANAIALLVGQLRK